MSTESTNPDREASSPQVFAFHSRSEDDTERIAALLAAMLVAGDCVTLTGELGAGKTAFTRGVARALGHDPRNVSSPTFVLLNEYLAPPDRASLQLLHADAYRLTDGDIESLGLDSRADQPHALLIEWPSRVASFIRSLDPSRVAEVELSHAPASPDQRLIRVALHPSWSSRAGYEAFQRAACTPAPSRTSHTGGAGADDTPRSWVSCPITGKPVAPDSPTWPFVDDHARRADLGRWLLGSYRVSREATQDDLEQLDRGSSSEC